MGLSLRHYLFADDGLKRLSRRLVEGLIHDQDAIPQYAGTKQRVASVTIQNENGKPTKLLKMEGWYFKFDEAGKIDDGCKRSIAQLALSSSDNRPTTNDRVTRDNRWKLTKGDRDRVAAEIWHKSKADAPRSLEGTTSKLPPSIPYKTQPERSVRQVKSKQHSETKSGAWRGFINAALPVLGNPLAVAGLIGLSILWEASTRSTSTSRVPTIAETEAVQVVFSKELLSATAPCAVKGKNYSDVRRCSLFGIGLRMSLEVVKQKIKSSAFFTREPYLIKGCHGSNKQCLGYVFEHKDGFSISVEFEPASDEGPKASLLIASDVTLWFMPTANPYFDPESMRPIFVKLIGEPDMSRDDGDRWGDVELTGGIPTV